MCTTLYRNLMQASNFGSAFDQPSFAFFYEIFTEDASLLLLYHGKKVKNDQKLKSRGGPALIATDRNGFRQMKEEGRIYNPLPQIF